MFCGLPTFLALDDDDDIEGFCSLVGQCQLALLNEVLTSTPVLSSRLRLLKATLHLMSVLANDEDV